MGLGVWVGWAQVMGRRERWGKTSKEGEEGRDRDRRRQRGRRGRHEGGGEKESERMRENERARVSWPEVGGESIHEYLYQTPAYPLTAGLQCPNVLH